MAALLLILGFADVSVGHFQVGCGTPWWSELREAIDAYCRDEAAPSERLGCRVANYSFTHCDAAPQLESAENGSLRGNIRDPREASYAWLMTFERGRKGWTLTWFKYEFDDCDALGIPAPPRGPLRLADLRHPME